MALVKNKTYYTYSDVTIVPGEVSSIEHRSECIPLDENFMLPLFTAPMDTVVNEANFQIFNEEMIYAILPRTIKLETRIDYSIKNRWAAYSLTEFEDVFCNTLQKLNESNGICALIDIANGHMKKVLDLIRAAKNIYGKNITIMVGNIANPKTFARLSEAGADFIRCGIGSGCFIANTNITLSDNTKKYIQDIQIGDKVKTINGNYDVIGKKEEKTNNLIKINNSITCTPNHKFLVINKEDKIRINENNINDYSYYIEAENLDKNKHLLVKML